MQELRSAAQALDRTAGSRRPEAEAAVATRWLGRRQSGSGAGRTWSQLARWGREMCSLPSSSSTAAIIPTQISGISLPPRAAPSRPKRRC